MTNELSHMKYGTQCFAVKCTNLLKGRTFLGEIFSPQYSHILAEQTETTYRKVRHLRCNIQHPTHTGQ